MNAYNCVYGNTAYDYSGITDPTGTNGNVKADPQFAGLAYGNIHIQPGPPCWNAGNNTDARGTLDIDGQARIQHGTVDIGADESDGSTWLGPPVVRVKPDGNDADDGSSWALAKRTVQGGIDAAAITGGEVWVKGGTYIERATLKLFTHVFGGFAGTELSRTERDWKTNTTVLDGGGSGGSVVSAQGHRISTVDGFTIRNGNSGSGGGIYCSSASPTLANLTITRNSASLGGGIYCSYASPVIANVVITGNGASSGGGIYCTSSSPTIANDTIVGNSASAGGGIYLTGSSPAVANTIVAFNGSGIYVTGGTPVLRYNCVYGNTAYDYSGIADPTGTNGNVKADPQFAGLAYGNVHIQPGPPCLDAGDDASIVGTTDIDNEARIQGAHVDIGADESDGTSWTLTPAVVCVKPDGDDANNGSSWGLAKRTVQGGIDAASAVGGEVWVKSGVYIERTTLKPFANVYGGFAGTETLRSERDWSTNGTVLDGGGQGGSVVSVWQGCQVSTLDGFTILNGAANSGGGIYCTAAPTIANVKIAGCIASSGGGIYCSSSAPVFVNVAITGNTALDSGGGIYCWSCTPQIINTTIVGNGAASGAGGGIYLNSASPVIANTIVAFNGSGICVSGGTPVLWNNCVYLNALYDYSGIADPTGSDGNISMDPLLADMSCANVHLQPASPCRNTGNNTFAIGIVDIDGQARIQDGKVDMGADESDGTTWEGPPAVLRVKPDGNDANDGSSWVLAKRTIQASLDAASVRGGEVWVQAGTYVERPNLGAAASLYGGFLGTETTRTGRDWRSNVTIVDGDWLYNTVRVVTGTLSTTVDGFTLRSGDGYYGGGVYCAGSSILANLSITGCTSFSGGGIYCSYASPSIVNTTITACSASSGGGGIYCSSSTPTIANVTITGNTAGDGGGIRLDNAAATIVNSIVAFNSSGIYMSGNKPTLRNNCVYGNTAYDYSGLSPGVGDISMDPQLVNQAGGDFHLTSASPCRDTGDDSVVQPGDLDLDGKPRIVGDHVDLGAYEYAKVATPVIDPDGGTFVGNVSVSLSDSTPGAAIRYTTGGIDPDLASTLYASPFDVLRSRTVKARAWKAGYDASDVAAADFVITPTGRDVPIRAGYSLIALPLEPAAPMKAADMIQSIAASGLDCTRVLRFNGSGYDVYTSAGVGTNFDVRPGEGYFVRCADAGIWHAPGLRFEAASAPIALAEGYNLVGLPVEPSPADRYPAATVIAEIAAQSGEATRILRFNGTGYDVYTSAGIGVNFTLRLGEGYFLRCAKSSTWTVTK